MKRLYLDYNATIPMLPQVKAALQDAMDLVGNASSIHQDGRRVRQYLENVRQDISTYFHVKPSQVVFTSGATEANNMVLKGFNGSVIVSAIEHDSVLQARPDVQICRVLSSGVIDLTHLESLIKNHAGKGKVPLLISIMAANNETGIIQPLDAIRALARHYGVYIHTDAVQVVGKWPLNWGALDFDFVSFSAHKIGGPQGVGALILNERIPLMPLMMGGGQERSWRSGTENVLGIIGFGAAMKAAVNQDWSSTAKMRDYLENELQKRCLSFNPYDYNGKYDRLPNTTNIRMPGVRNNSQVMYFDLQGISLSAGSACSSGKIKASHVFQAMGVPESTFQETIRVSLGREHSREDIDRFVGVWEELYRRSGMTGTAQDVRKFQELRV